MENDINALVREHRAVIRRAYLRAMIALIGIEAYDAQDDTALTVIDKVVDALQRRAEDAANAEADTNGEGSESAPLVPFDLTDAEKETFRKLRSGELVVITAMGGFPAPFGHTDTPSEADPAGLGAAITDAEREAAERDAAKLIP